MQKDLGPNRYARIHKVLKTLLAVGYLTTGVMQYTAHADEIWGASTFNTWPTWTANGVDDFAGKGQTVGETQWGFKPILTDGPSYPFTLPPNQDFYAVFRNLAYNKYNPGQYFRGTEIYSGSWGDLQPNTALEFEAWMKFPDYAPRLVCAFFVSDDAGPDNQNEIDFEIPLQLLRTNDLWLNLLSKAPDQAIGTSIDKQRRGSPLQSTTHRSWGKWHDFKIRWGYSYVKWFIDGNLVREIPRSDLPKVLPSTTAKMKIHFNIWVAPRDWDMAKRECLSQSRYT